MAAYGLYTHIASNKFRSMLLLGGLFLLIYVLVYAGALLAEVFLRNPGQVLSREQLLSHVWGYDFDPGSNVVDVYVRHLRRKLGAERISTLRGMGYRLEALE